MQGGRLSTVLQCARVAGQNPVGRHAVAAYAYATLHACQQALRVVKRHNVQDDDKAMRDGCFNQRQLCFVRKDRLTRVDLPAPLGPASRGKKPAGASLGQLSVFFHHLTHALGQ